MDPKDKRLREQLISDENRTRQNAYANVRFPDPRPPPPIPTTPAPKGSYDPLSNNVAQQPQEKQPSFSNAAHAARPPDKEPATAKAHETERENKHQNRDSPTASASLRNKTKEHPSAPSTSSPSTPAPIVPCQAPEQIILAFHEKFKRDIDDFINTSKSELYVARSKSVKIPLLRRKFREFNRTLRIRRNYVLARYRYQPNASEHLTAKRIAHIRVLVARVADSLMHESEDGDANFYYARNIQIETKHQNKNKNQQPTEQPNQQPKEYEYDKTQPPPTIYELLQGIHPLMRPGQTDVDKIAEAALFLASQGLHMLDYSDKPASIARTHAYLTENILLSAEILKAHRNAVADADAKA